MIFCIYARKSIYSDKGESIKNQILMCENYIKNKFFEDINIIKFIDEGISGNIFNRPAFNSMLQFINSNCVNFVVVYKIDRLSRNISHFSNIISLFENKNVEFLSVKEEFDTSKPIGKAMLYISTIFAQLERDTIAERVKDNMYFLAKKGYWLGGNLPTGYISKPIISNKKKFFILDINKSEAKKVTLIFKLMLEKKSVSKVSFYLKQYNIKSKNNKYFSNNALRQILTNPVYCKCEKAIFSYFKNRGVPLNFSYDKNFKNNGLLVYSRKTYTNFKPKNNDVKNWIIARGFHTGLINSKDWIFIQSFFKDYSMHKPHNNLALFSGKIICKHCGEKMIFKANSNIKNNGTFYYICRSKINFGAKSCVCKNINGKILDEEFWQMFKQKFNLNNEYSIYEKRNFIDLYLKEITWDSCNLNIAFK